MPLLFLLLACQPEPADVHDDSVVAPADSVDSVDSDPAVSLLDYEGPAYAPCVSDAQCDAGSACSSVPGYAGLYCAPPCDPSLPDDPSCALPGLEYDTTCLPSGRCARACGEPDSCPETLECSPEPVDSYGTLCAGEEYGLAGPYGTCTHPNVSGPDCPEETSCFGGEYLGIEDGACLPWCDTGECPSPPEDTSGVSPVCYDAGLDHPVCALLCVPDSATCPEGQECLSFGSFGICAPLGADY